MKIRLYTIQNCPFCSELKSELNKLELPFDEVDVNANENKSEYDKLYSITKSDSVPIIKIYNKLLVPNKSFHSIKQAIEIILDLISKN